MSSMLGSITSNMLKESLHGFLWRNIRVLIGAVVEYKMASGSTIVSRGGKGHTSMVVDVGKKDLTCPKWAVFQDSEILA